MVISSRTPEGEPAICPTCAAFVHAEPSLFFSDATCPSCGSLLWFVQLGEQTLVVRPGDEARRKGLATVIAAVVGLDEKQLSANPESYADFEFDSLDLAEFVAAFEDQASD